jgi:protein TonB
MASAFSICSHKFMFFFKNAEDVWRKSRLTSAAPISSSLRMLHFICSAALGEERPRSMLGLLTVLVLLLHVWILLQLTEPEKLRMEARPFAMEVTLVAAPQAAKEVQAAAAPPPPAKQPIPPKNTKPKPKPLKVKKPPAVVKPPEVRQAQLPQAETKPAAPAASVSAPAVNTTAAASSTKGTLAGTEKFTEANFHANYGINPKPEYPRLARNRGWQGKVLLRVQVTAEGRSGAVNVHKSSGYEMLDESAIDAVEKWKFIPAKRGETPIASSVIVPIIFKLND